MSGSSAEEQDESYRSYALDELQNDIEYARSGMWPGMTRTMAFERIVEHTQEQAGRIRLMGRTIKRLRAVELAAQEQSGEIQQHWLSPAEARGLKGELERLRAYHRNPGWDDPREDGELCIDCRRRYLDVYKVPDEEWRAVTGWEHPAGLLCPECYAKRKAKHDRLAAAEAIVARVKDPDTIQHALRCTAPSLRTGERLGMMAFRREVLGEAP